mmetsp:Transcript_73214/g.169839  ORF Transcript_73214/g.169839 Transcript_73214/m.169839 type:complete len:508 (+) Transcript_73214:2-1525(+)
MVISNCWILSTGFDVPALDAVIFVDNRHSKINILQCVARTARLAPEKQFGYVIVPMYTKADVRGDEEEALGILDVDGHRSEAYGDIVDLLHVLASQDAKMDEAFRQYSRLLGTAQAGQGEKPLAPQELRNRLVTLGEVSLEDIDKAIELAAVELATWEQYFGMLVAYKDTHGDCYVPESYTTRDGFSLGRFVSNQRKAFNTKQLLPSRQAQLDEIGFVWNCKDFKWDRHFWALSAYEARHGNCLVPANYSTSNGLALGQWVKKQRDRFRRGALEPDRIERLDSLNFVYEVLLGWEARFSDLVKFKELYGHCRVQPKYKTPEGFGLGVWTQVQKKKMLRGQLTEDRVAKLKSIGVEARPRIGWDDGFQALKEHVAVHGKGRFERTTVTPTGFPLGRWYWRVEAQRKRGVLKKERVQQLEKLGVWRPPTKGGRSYGDSWQQAFKRFQDYYAKFGTLKIPQLYKAPDGFRLGKWVERQVERKKLGKLEAERVEALREIGLFSNASDEDTN